MVVDPDGPKGSRKSMILRFCLAYYGSVCLIAKQVYLKGKLCEPNHLRSCHSGELPYDWMGASENYVLSRFSSLQYRDGTSRDVKRDVSKTEKYSKNGYFLTGLIGSASISLWLNHWLIIMRAKDNILVFCLFSSIQIFVFSSFYSCTQLLLVVCLSNSPIGRPETRPTSKLGNIFISMLTRNKIALTMGK